MQRFGEKLRALRQHSGMTLHDVATALGYSAHTHISVLEHGKKQPTAALVLKVAQLFGVTTDQLLRDDLELGAMLPEIAAQQSVQFVTVNGRRLVVISADDWEALLEWLEAIEDSAVAREAFAQLKTAQRWSFGQLRRDPLN
jgi:transcriptional regulator with XRE-family HTH domain